MFLFLHPTFLESSLTSMSTLGPRLKCNVHATFYNDSATTASCFPPSAGCMATQQGLVLGTVQFSGIWPSCASVDFSFPLIINGGTGPFIGVSGWVNATQPVDYSHFTYHMHFN